MVYDPERPDHILTHDELVVLAGALRVMMMVDGVVSEDEIRYASECARQLRMGLDEWDAIWTEASQRLATTDRVKIAVAHLGRPQAREMVYELLYEMAESDFISSVEWDFLEWLDETWQSEPWRREPHDRISIVKSIRNA